MRHLTAQMVADAINQLESPFDAHDVEKKVLRLYSVETAQEIVAKAGSRDALRSFSAVFARYVDRTFGGPAGQIRQTTRVKSENLGGAESKNQQWERLVTPVVAPPRPAHKPEGDIESEADDAEIQEDEQTQRATHAVALRNAAGRMDESP